MSIKYITNKSDKSQRADLLLATSLVEYSRSALAKLFDLQDVKSGTVSIRAGAKIKSGQKIQVNMAKLQKPADSIDLPIIYEDENVIVIDKPTGVISHARGKYWDEPSVASFVRSKVTGIEGKRAGIVHRLDRATSGVMICAKNPQTLSFLQKQFASKKTKKTYIAVVHGILEPSKALIDIPIGRNPKKPQTFRPDINGKASSTTYKVIKTYDALSLLELKPATGRTHQLRVHLQHIKHPILGDDLYGGQKSDRLFLHAHSLEITLPGGKRRVFNSVVPKEFKQKLDESTL